MMMMMMMTMMKVIRSLFLLLALKLPDGVDAEPIRVVLILNRELEGRVIGPAFLVALRDVRAELGIDVTWRVCDSQGNRATVMSSYVDWMDNFQPHVVIGSRDENITKLLVYLSAASDTLYISIGGNSERWLTSADLYPTFSSIGRGHENIGVLVYEVMRTFNWTRVAIISSTAQINKIQSDYIVHHLTSKNKGGKCGCYTYSIAHTSVDEDQLEAKKDSIDIMLKYLKDKAIFFIFLMDIKEIQFIWQRGLKHDLFPTRYVILTFGMKEKMGINSLSDYGALVGFLTIDRNMLEEGIDSDLDIKVNGASNSPEWMANAKDWTRPSSLPEEPVMKSYLKSACLLYDAVKLWGQSLKALKDEKKTDWIETAKDGKGLARISRTIRTRGYSGSVTFSKKGIRTANWSLSMVIGRSQVKELMSYSDTTRKLRIRGLEGLTWIDGKEYPPTEPVCFGDNCKILPPLVIIIVCSVVVPLVIILIVGLIVFSRFWKGYQEKQFIANWKINWAEVTIMQDSNVNNSAEETTTSVMDTSRDIMPTGMYKGKMIAIKFVKRGSVDIFENTVYTELREMLYIKHDNLNQFVGLCVDAPNVCVAMAFAEKGSLRDILANPDADIDWDFRISFAMDIAKGMEYLHDSTPIGAHGHLNSANCVVDERYICKITDYGLKRFRCLDKIVKPLSELLWTAPELLQKKVTEPERIYGTKPGDIYSFGIIMAELITRQLPYRHELRTSTIEELLVKIKMSFEPPFRTSLAVEGESFSDETLMLVRQCWQTSAFRRPSFTMVITILHSNSSGKFTSVLERLQNVLEESIDRANAELNSERRRTEEVLQTILPRSVAETVAAGKEVHPSLVSSVTVCLCDTTGFYKIIGDLQMDTVIDVLKKLYAKYDEIVKKHNAYLVGIWGSKDSMMLAGGLPMNADATPDVMCTMALDLMSSVEDFKHPKIPRHTFDMKISIHTGPAYTAVVGKTPQFCVFGETVQMLSNLHMLVEFKSIRISEETKDRVSKSKKFKFKSAGKVALREGQTINTYVLYSSDKDYPRRRSLSLDNLRTGKSPRAVDIKSPPFVKLKKLGKKEKKLLPVA